MPTKSNKKKSMSDKILCSLVAGTHWHMNMTAMHTYTRCLTYLYTTMRNHNLIQAVKAFISTPSG